MIIIVIRSRLPLYNIKLDIILVHISHNVIIEVIYYYIIILRDAHMTVYFLAYIFNTNKRVLHKCIKLGTFYNICI